MGGFEYTGGLWGYEKERAEDEYERRTQIRKNFRSPGEQTLSELGEGRGKQLSSPCIAVMRIVLMLGLGLYGPGYAERRRERIKEAYGVEVPTSQAPAS